jgi:alkylhydroperoxidase/carboxymuconolactone decarboxylase family protein YurZ
LMIYAGFPAAWQAMVIANQVIAEPPMPSTESR